MVANLSKTARGLSPGASGLLLAASEDYGRGVQCRADRWNSRIGTGAGLRPSQKDAQKVLPNNFPNHTILLSPAPP